MRHPFRRLAAFVGSAFLWGATSLAIGLPVTLTGVARAEAACLGTHRTISLSPRNGNFYNGLEKSLGLRDGEVILTFDDGPVPGKTDRILDALADECARATFFMSGRMAASYPELGARVRREGHTVANHTHAHENLANLTSPAVLAAIGKGRRAIRKATGETDLSFFRYPYLARSSRTDGLIRAQGLIAFGTNIDSKDYKKVSSAQVVEKVMRTLRKQRKGIILMHDIHARTVGAVPVLLDRLKAEGYRIVHMVPAGREAPSADVVVASATPEAAVPQARTRPAGSAREAVARADARPAVALPESVRTLGVRILGGAQPDARGRRERQPIVAAAYARSESQAKAREARIDALKRGPGKPLTAAQKLRYRYKVRREFKTVATLPLHMRGETVLRLERRQ